MKANAAPYQLVGLSGKAGAGKDYCAERFFERRGYRRLSFAWLLKWVCIGQGKCTWAEAFVTKPEHVRTLLQNEGMTWRATYGDDTWVRGLDAVARTLAELHGTSRFVVADARFPEELNTITRLGGRIVRVSAPTRVAANGFTPAQRVHPSEIALDGLPDSYFDLVVNNEPGADVLAQLAAHFDAP